MVPNASEDRVFNRELMNVSASFLKVTPMLYIIFLMWSVLAILKLS